MRAGGNIGGSNTRKGREGSSRREGEEEEEGWGGRRERWWDDGRIKEEYERWRNWRGKD